MNKRKLLTLAMTLCMVAILAIGGTLAYFTDTDKAANTFELGGVDIELIERAYDFKEGKWEEIEDPDGIANLDQLDPVDETDWDAITRAGYAYNKGVFTHNFGHDDAYIRNYVAVESVENAQGDEIYELFWLTEDAANPSESDYRHGSVETKKFDDVKINGTTYDIYVYDTVGNAAVKPGESFVTLDTVVLKSWATNADVANLGTKFEVYTFSEAIQTTGFANHAEAMAELAGGADEAALKAHALELIKPLVSAIVTSK